nr:sprT-like domain-containing protein Spartan isoform X5 [Globicephala melas]
MEELDPAVRGSGTWSPPAAMDEDLVLALQLQEEWNLQVLERDPAQEPLSLVDASWELVDPTPDIQALFMLFNDRFFWGHLEAVEVKWSMRMTLCAGICSYEGRGGMCSIRLSEPLLKLRPRKDLVETLLHEMIHAYLFVTNNDKDREGHGPEFCKHMRRINRLTGANITVYHTFHDEVDEYRRHWWRCNGPCQHKKPYYGYVKRATNRAPSAHDYWWAEHQKTCGGTYIKIKEPESYSKKGKGKTKPGKQPVSEAENKERLQPHRIRDSIKSNVCEAVSRAETGTGGTGGEAGIQDAAPCGVTGPPASTQGFFWPLATPLSRHSLR